MRAIDRYRGFSATFDLLGDSVMVAGIDGRIVYVNRAFEATTGYTREEAVGRSCSLLKSGSHPRQLYDELWAALGRKEPFRTILVNRRKDGELYEEGMIISPMLGLDGEVEYYLAIGREVDAWRQTFDAFLVLANKWPAGVYVVRNGRVVYANQEVATYAGTEVKAMIDRPWAEFVAEADRERVEQQALDMLAGRRDGPIEFRMVQPNGDVRWVMQAVRHIDFREARFAGMDVVCGNLVDITDRHVAEERLRRALSMQRATGEATTDGILVTDGDGGLVSSNNRFRALWNLQHFVSPSAGLDAIYRAMEAQMAQPAVFVAALERLGSSPDASETLSIELLDGRVVELFSNAFVLDGTPQGRVWSWRDVTERRRFEMAMLQLANHDSLTGLINRRRLQELMQKEIETDGEASSGALLMLDLDRFKEINDSLGHQAGDEVLIRVGATLRKTLPEQYVARFGGDEFAVFMPGAGTTAARAAAARIIDAIESGSYSARGIDVPVTASIGIAVAPGHGINPDELLANADVAMYAAKGAGRNRYRVYSQAIHSRASLEARRHMQAELQEAVEAQRWKVYTRPSLCMTNSGPTLHHLEPRFTRPDGSVLPQPEQGTLGEHAGLLKSLDHWMVGEAGRVLDKIAGGTGRAVSITLPWQTLLDREMVAAMRAAMKRSLPSDASIFVEMTGLDTLQDGRRLARTMQSLRDHGYRFVLCVVSVAQLPRVVQSLPVDLIRLQAGLVAALPKDRVTQELLTGVVRVMHGVGVGVMASDVNSAATLDCLREAGVDYVRGSRVGRARLASSLLRQLQSPPKAA